jgi:hypothetical protein
VANLCEISGSHSSVADDSSQGCDSLFELVVSPSFQRSLLGLLNCEDEGGMTLQNVLNSSPNDLASHPLRLDFSGKTDISSLHFTNGEQHGFIKVWLNDMHCHIYGISTLSSVVPIISQDACKQ